MNKALAIIFGIVSIGAIKEALRITFSSASDIAPNRIGLIVISYTLTILFIFLTVRFWRKASKKPGL
ncbi:hypothetical protein [Dinghuibacter silviterrae]|uniref:Uncharacterized protein n=1 Tax=Dinghuibacter silviterrae TaxID=1539049 RepID=A0A4R8DQZ2_9BACT|nr:hypothetical protein [Dinghuibacter silviterrae]TDW99746.1 hypothetical protein EDB95_0757 [Dinghuibacter silviterrae]